MLRRRTTLIISLVVIHFGSSLHVLGMKMRILVCYAYVWVLLLLSNREKICLSVESLIWDRLTIFSLLLRPNI